MSIKMLYKRFYLTFFSGNFKIALDAARPCFEKIYCFGIHPQTHLMKSDAQFVDVIHTCALGAGILHAAGHADFYPNGGCPLQPGCTVNLFALMSEYDLYN